tara:strand:+ start:1521 stop:1643 length:123 start_codon:yes stop_codon:yes gene_type:complete
MGWKYRLGRWSHRLWVKVRWEVEMTWWRITRWWEERRNRL